MDKYVKMLKNNNLKVTPQRLEILKYLDKHRTHPTADEIHRSLKEKNPSLSKTTVYNSLEKLVEKNIIQSLTSCTSENHYDFNEKMHHHFICKQCGKVYDIDFKCPNIKKIKEKIREKGHCIDEIHGHSKGICKECIKKQ